MERHRALRLTGRGRAVLFGLLVLLAVLLVVLAAALAASASQAAGAAGRETVVVQPGDTLWSVSARHVPSRDPYGIIEEIRRLNGLPDNTVHPGQELVLP